MLIDAAHKEEVRVVVINDERIEDFEVETADKEQIKGNIYVAEVTRVEPSLQAAFVNYGGNRNGFLAFSEIHPGYFDLPKEEKDALLKELDDIAAKRKGRDTEAEERLEEESRVKEEAKNSKKSEVKTDEVDATDSAITEVVEATEEAPKPKRRGRKSKATLAAEAKEAEDAAVKQAAQEAAKKDIPESLEGLTPEEMEEDARALALASSIIIDDQEAPVEDAPKARRGRPARKPKRHIKSETAETGKKLADEEVNGNKEDSIKEKPAETKDVKKDDKEDADERRQPIHRRYNIKDVLKEGSKILIQINKEERGNKGAAVSTYVSLPGRYSVLMPNTPYAGGISRKITDFSVRRKIKSIVSGLNIPNSMGVIIRTAGVGQEPENIEKDVNNMLGLWKKIDEDFNSNKKAPQLVHEDGSLSIRAIRDMFKADVDEVCIAGSKTYRATKDYIQNLMPEFASKVKEHTLQTPVFAHYDVEEKLNRLHTTRVNLPSGGYLIINPTEALISVDVNSGKATQEKNIEDTALKTNLEAAEEMARQLRLRDLAGLIVIDFIDMEENKNEKAVERMMRKCIRKDRARIQIAPISTFGLLEMSRQRLRPSLGESTTQACKHCNGTGMVASLASAALTLLRSLEDENVRTKADRIIITTSDDLALYILNHKRELVKEIEGRYKFTVYIRGDDKYEAPDHRIEVVRKDSRGHEKTHTTEVSLREPMDDDEHSKPTRRRTRKVKPDNKDKPKHQNDKQTKDSKSSDGKTDDKENSVKGDDDDTEKKGRRSGGRVRHLRRGARRDEKDGNLEDSAKETKSDNTGDTKSDDKKPARRGRGRPSKKADDKVSDDAKPVKSAEPLSEGNIKAREHNEMMLARKDKMAKDKPTKEKKVTAKPTKAEPAKGITVEHISATGESSIAKNKDDSVGGKFQRWWNKTTS